MSQADVLLSVVLPVHGDRVSPFFDSALRVLVVEIADGEEGSRREVERPPRGSRYRMRALRNLGVQALVCNAISKRSLSEALDLGLSVWSGVDGSLQEVIDSLCSMGGLDEVLAMRGTLTRPSGRVRPRVPSMH